MDISVYFIKFKYLMGSFVCCLVNWSLFIVKMVNLNIHSLFSHSERVLLANRISFTLNFQLLLKIRDSLKIRIELTFRRITLMDRHEHDITFLHDVEVLKIVSICDLWVAWMGKSKLVVKYRIISTQRVYFFWKLRKCLWITKGQ